MIRQAKCKDVDTICQLYSELFAQMAEIQPQYWKETSQSSAFVQEMVEEDDSIVLVLELAGNVCGFIIAEERHTPPFAPIRPYKHAYVLDLYIGKEHRGKGWGRALLAGVERWATKRELSFVELEVLTENAQARQLYERKGYKDTVHTMRKPL